MNYEPSDEQKLKDRQESIFWCQRLLDHPDSWCVLDTETTGLNPKSCRVVEVSVMDGRGDSLIDTLVNPEISISADSSRIHGISDLQVINSPTIRELWADLLKAVDGRMIVAYNSAYDKSVLRYEAYRNGLSEIPSDWECAMIRYSAFVGEWDPRFKNYRYQKLPSAGHRSILDCRVTLDLLHMMSQASV